MKMLTDLTTKQIAAAIGVITETNVSPKMFNTKARAITRLEALLAEKNLTVDDALRAAGIETDQELSTAPMEAIEPTGTNDEVLTPEAIDAPVAPIEVAPPLDTPIDDFVATTLSNLHVSADIQAMVFIYLTNLGITEPDAKAAAIRLGNALPVPHLSQASRAPRTGTKQDQLIDLLRRQEGATIAQMVEATNWLSHTVRGALAGALKKKLGLTVTSAKVSGSERVYHIV